MRGIPQLLFAMTLASTVAQAAGPAGGEASPDTSQWRCEICPFDHGWGGAVELGAGNVSDDSFKFGKYNGLHGEGLFAIGNAQLSYRDQDADYWTLKGKDLGLDSRSAELSGGRQGVYEIRVLFDQLPSLLFDTTRTPFRNNGQSNLVLPPGWVRAGDTAGMSALATSLHNKDIEHDRKRFGVGASAPAVGNWSFRVDARHEERQGTKQFGGAFLFNSAILAEPIDYVTDELEAAMNYTGRRLQAGLAYYGSFFDDRHNVLNWQNPYTAVTPGADTGRSTLPPDNKFHQLILSGGYQISDTTRANADVAIGRMTQDESFFPYTTNGSLAASALPRNSLNGRVDTLTANLGITSRPLPRLGLAAAVRYNNRDNDTLRSVYAPVITDAFLDSPRINLPYSFKHGAVKLRADYRLPENAKVTAGYDYDNHRRDFQDVDETREHTFWGKFDVRHWENTTLSFRIAHATRDGDDFSPVPEIVPPENPLLRKFNLADRERNEVRAYAAFTPYERVNLGTGIEFTDDDYSDNTLGLTEGSAITYTADASWVPTDKLNLHGFFNAERIRTEMAGSQGFSTPDWTAEQEDIIYTTGIGMELTGIRNRFDVGADYIYTQANGDIRAGTGIAAVFPDLQTRNHSVQLHGDYHARKDLSLRLGYRYERYRSSDWVIEDVEPATIANVLSMGEDPFSYNIHLVTLSVRYKF